MSAADTFSRAVDPGDGEFEERPGVAIVGMAGRFPGADDVNAFWRMIREGRSGVTHFTPDELEIQIDGAAATGECDAAARYVCAKGQLSDVDMFDARFFGYLPREAEVMDPQHRVFLELCWHALEHAGCDPARYPGAVGVFAGCYMDTYVLWNLCSDEAFRSRLVESIQVGTLQTELGNDKDYLATRVAYKLGLTGPAMTLQTACSTSLVAIAQACQSLEAYACDMALAGGVTIVLPQKKGYFYKEGGMLSPDGVCRTFDANAAGTVFSNGAAVLGLKRVDDAIADKDRIYAVIRGYATNNDGGGKVSYTAPSVEGQADVIGMALDSAGVDARTVGYVEAHGTATPLGDPIEVAGLTAAYRRHTDDKGYCAIGSVKANLGHLDVASGAIGLIKTALCLDEKVLPPQINFEKTNPKIDFEASPFFVNPEGGAWPAGETPRRAGVSSFGVGGTNAHVVVEEAPVTGEDEPDDRRLTKDGALLVLSAKTDSALKVVSTQLAEHLQVNEQTSLADTAYTLQTGRREFERRTCVYAKDRDEAIAALRSGLPVTTPINAAPELVFVLPGQGAQHPAMARGLYDAWPTFRDHYEECLNALSLTNATLADEIRTLSLWRADGSLSWEAAGARLAETSLAQPAIAAFGIALSRSLAVWGVFPSKVIGHSVGEFAAAYLAGVLSLQDVMRLVAVRGRLMQAMAPGAMLAVREGFDAVAAILPEELSIAAENGPSTTVVSGTSEAISSFEADCGVRDIGVSRLRTSHAFHSGMMAPAAEAFAAEVAGVRLNAPARHVISSSEPDGPSERFADASYWSDQVVRPVRFAEAVRRAGAEGGQIFVEIGPGAALSAMARQTLGPPSGCGFAALSPPPGRESAAAISALGTGVGALWALGAGVDWDAFNGGRRRKTPLPTYPFERKRFWIEPTDSRSKSGEEPVVARAGSVENGDAGAGEDVEALVRMQLAVVSAQIDLLRRR
ncbi:MAG: type I polyketide synthase [Pseudomonadota bacterium]